MDGTRLRQDRHDDDDDFDPTLFLHMTPSECYHRSPGQHVPHYYDKVYGNRPVSIWNQAHGLAVQL